MPTQSGPVVPMAARFRNAAKEQRRSSARAIFFRRNGDSASVHGRTRAANAPSLSNAKSGSGGDYKTHRMIRSAATASVAQSGRRPKGESAGMSVVASVRPGGRR